jgi:hypothetical protein
MTENDRKSCPCAACQGDHNSGVDPTLYHNRGVNEALLSDAKGRCRCGENRAAAMTNKGHCYACRCRELGQAVVENHHLFGKTVPIIVPMPANEHRVFDALRLARIPILREPSNDPIVNAPALLMQFVEIMEMQCMSRDARIGVGRREKQTWADQIADILADKGREAAEALLAVAGYLRG